MATTRRGPGRPRARRRPRGPAARWRAPASAEIRFAGGDGCRVSYFFEARRRRVSPPRPQVLDVDLHRPPLAPAHRPPGAAPRPLPRARADGRSVAVRQIFSGREVARIDRDWAPGPLESALTALHFDPDGR